MTERSKEILDDATKDKVGEVVKGKNILVTGGTVHGKCVYYFHAHNV